VQPAIVEPLEADAKAPSGLAPERLPLGIKLAFGAPAFAGAAMAIPLAIHLTIFYSDVILVPLGVIALAKSLGRAFDALTDPLMGWVTDRTRTRWGRRRPWIALGAPGAGLAFLAMFTPPESFGPAAAGVWLGVMYIVYSIFQTVYQIPNYGLGAELTLDYRERNSLFSWEQAFSVAGTLFASAVPGLLAAQLGARRGYFWFAAVFGGLLVGLMWNLVFRVRERASFVMRPPNPLVPGVRRVLRNRAFRLLLTVYVIGALTGAIPGTLMPYFVTYVLRPEGQPLNWISLYLILYFGTGLLCLPLWVWLANRIGKKATWLFSFISGGTGSLALFFVPEGATVLFGAILVWAGSSFAARLFLGPSIQADVIDYDELLTGKRREAQYGGLWSIMTKFAVIPSLTIPLAVLAAYGYEPNVDQTDDVKLAIRSIFALAPACTALIAFSVACFFPITQSVHQEVQAGIEAHRRGESVIDPVSGARLAPPNDRGVGEDAGWFLDHFSKGELRRSLGSGPATLVRDAAFWLAVSIGLCVGGAVYVFETVRTLSAEPGLMPVLALIVAGLSFNAVVFHIVRLRAALVHLRKPFDAATLRAHVMSP
jgi:GPH family glycoside/pentoside/hexuronide:cation symporter